MNPDYHHASKPAAFQEFLDGHLIGYPAWQSRNREMGRWCRRAVFGKRGEMISGRVATSA